MDNSTSQDLPFEVARGLEGFATQLRGWMKEGRGLFVVVDGGDGLVAEGGTMTDRVAVALALAHAVDPSWNLEENAIFGADVANLVEHLECERPHVIFVDDGAAVFAKLDWEAQCALEGNRHLLIVCVESIWGFADRPQSMIDFRLHANSESKSYDVSFSPAKRAIGAEPYERDRSLGCALLLRSRRLDDPSSLERSMTLLRRVVANRHGSMQEQEQDLGHLTGALVDCFNITRDPALLDEAVEAGRAVLAGAPPHSADFVAHLANLVETLGARAEARGSIDQLDEPLATLRRELTGGDLDRDHRCRALGALSKVLCVKAKISRDGAAWDDAVAAWERAVASTSRRSWERPAYLGELASALLDRRERTGNPDDFDRARSAVGAALRTPGVRPAEVAPLLTTLGSIELEEYELRGGLDRLAKLIRILERAVGLTERKSPELAARTKNLASALLVRYRLTSDQADLDRALTLLRGAVRGLRPDFPNYSAIVNGLAVALHEQYDRTGDEAVLQEAKEYQRAAFSSLATDSPDFPPHLGNRAIVQFEEYAKGVDANSLDAAIESCIRAINDSPPASLQKLQLVNNVGLMLKARYATRGNLTDLETAHLLYADALKTTPLTSPGRRMLLTNLGSVLLDVYRSTGNLNPLEAAVAAQRKAIELTPESATDRPTVLNNLAAALLARHQETGNQGDLDEAIGTFRGVADDPGVPARFVPGILGNLSGALALRLAISGRTDDIEEAIHVGDRALSLFGADAPDALGVRMNLADAIRLHPRAREDGSFRTRAAQLYRETCERGFNAAPAICAIAAAKWLRYAFELRDWPSVVRAYDWLRKAGDKILALNPASRSRRTSLKDFQGLSSMACFAFAMLGDAEGSCLALERGRARLLAEAQAKARLYRTMGEDKPEVYHRQIEISRELEKLDELPDFSVDGSLALERMTRKYALLEEQRGLSATNDETDGLQPFGDVEVGVRDLKSIAQRLPADSALVYLATTSIGTVAIMLTSDRSDMSVAPFKESDLLGSLVSQSASGGPQYLEVQFDPQASVFPLLPGLLDVLGSGLMEPLAARLRSRSVRQVCFLVAGPLALLPIHAAVWYENGNRRCFLDEFVTSYAPTALSVDFALERLSTREPFGRFLGIADPDGTLPIARVEVREISKLLPEHDAETLVGEAATPEKVRLLSARAKYLHFACHGRYLLEDPLSSGMSLAGGRITIGDLLVGRLEVRAARLAVLSACQTAMTEFGHLPDEFLGLPTGFLSSGVPAVVGTLWSVPDDSTALLMVKFYELLLDAPDGPLAPAAALRKAQVWLREFDPDLQGEFLAAHPDLRVRLRSNPRIQGREARDPEAMRRPFEHPYYWAPFTFVGV